MNNQLHLNHSYKIKILYDILFFFSNIFLFLIPETELCACDKFFLAKNQTKYTKSIHKVNIKESAMNICTKNLNKSSKGNSSFISFF